MKLLKKIIKIIIYVLRSIYEVMYIYPKYRYEVLYEIEERLKLNKENKAS